ncbi:MAG: sigma-70 family RNA polymerase sigma factor [Oscillibacter sp.]|nr:sigma-70 family RNA polymerase sigma factor [uncultured Oscillibacter sp.]MCI8969951.1 sigma-70 family RNA polymerase sigma factor [Oscillibacter sp.]
MIVFTVPGDDPAGTAFLRDLYRRYSRLMFAEALRRVSNRQDCEDIVQDAMESLCQKADALRELPAAALPAYVVYTVKNKATDFLRHQAVVGRHTADLGDGCLEDFQSPAPSLEELAELRERMDGLGKAWHLLPEEDQELLYRKYVLGQDNGELAEVFHCRRDSMRMRLTRARRRAAKLMKGGNGHDASRTLA